MNVVSGHCLALEASETETGLVNSYLKVGNLNVDAFLQITNS